MTQEQWIIALERLSNLQTVNEWEFSERDPRYHIDKEALYEALYETLSTLTEREASVVIWREIEGKTLREVGKLCNVTQERVRQVHLKALRKLRHPNRSNKLYKMMLNLSEKEFISEKKKEEARLKEWKEKYEKESKLRAEIEREAYYKAEKEKLLNNLKHSFEDALSLGKSKYRTPIKPPDFCVLRCSPNFQWYIAVPPDRVITIDDETYFKWLLWMLEDYDKKGRPDLTV